MYSSDQRRREKQRGEREPLIQPNERWFGYYESLRSGRAERPQTFLLTKHTHTAVVNFLPSLQFSPPVHTWGTFNRSRKNGCFTLSLSRWMPGGQGRVKCAGSLNSALRVCWKLLVQPLNTVIWHIPTGAWSIEQLLTQTSGFGHEGAPVHLCAGALAGGGLGREVGAGLAADSGISSWQRAERILRWPFEIEEGEGKTALSVSWCLQ